MASSTDAALERAVAELTVPEARQLLARLKSDDGGPRYFELPVGPREFFLSEDYLNRDPDDVYPAILDELEEIFEEEGDGSGSFRRWEAVLLKSIGAGKSFEAAGIIVYMVYRILCFEDPQANFKLAANSKLAALVVAPTAKKARDLVFDFAKGFVDSSPWFDRYYPRDKRIKTELRFDWEPVDASGRPLPSAIGKKFKNVYVLAGSGSRNAALGYTLFCAVIDEANFWETFESIRKGTNERIDQMFLSLQRRVFSRMMVDGRLFGMVVVISSSMHEDDFAEQKGLESGTNDRVYFTRKAIWEVKPKGTYSAETFQMEAKLQGLEITLEIPVDFREEFRKNPTAALRDYASIPAAAEGAFFNPSIVEELKAAMAQMPASVDQADPWGYVLDPKDWGPLVRNPKQHLCWIHCDLGIRRDEFGMALGYWNPARNRLTIPLVHKITVSVDHPLQFDVIQKMILGLRDLGWAIHKASFDNFQSEETLQRLEFQGVPVEKVSVDRNTIPYDTFLEYVNERAVDVPPHPDLFKQMKRLVLVAGKKVDHPKGGAKDVADAAAGVAFGVARDLRAITYEGVGPGDGFGADPPSGDRSEGGDDGARGGRW